MNHPHTSLAPITEAGPAYSRVVLACSDMGDLTPGVYAVVVRDDGSVAVTTGARDHKLGADTATARNLRGLLTALRHGMIG